MSSLHVSLFYIIIQYRFSARESLERGGKEICGEYVGRRGMMGDGNRVGLDG